MKLIKVLRNILQHPLNRRNSARALLRFAKWQLSTRLNPHPVIFPFASRSKLVMQKGLSGATGNIYCGLHEFADMSFVLHFLRDTDLFVDIGANVGSYTILAASEVGAQTISFEPIPRTYSHLLTNISVNNVSGKVEAKNMGLGGVMGTLKFTRSLDVVNHVATETDLDTIEVPVEVFDRVVDMQNATLVKIDVEGYETMVLNGMSESLANGHLKAIIIELNGAGSRYGFKDEDIHQKLLSNNFKPFKYSPFDRVLTPVATFGTHNTIYIRDLDVVESRIRTAPKFKIFDYSI